MGKDTKYTSYYNPGMSTQDTVEIMLQNWPESNLFPMYRDRENGIVSPWTISFWFYVTKLDESELLWFGKAIPKYGTILANSIIVEISSGGAIQFNYDGKNFRTASGITEGKWYNMTITFNGTTANTIYSSDFTMNIKSTDSTDATITSNGTSNSTSGNIIYDSSYGNTYGFWYGSHSLGSSGTVTTPGYRSDLAIWNEEILDFDKIWNNGQPGNLFELNIPRPVHWWSFQKTLANNISGGPSFSFTDEEFGISPSYYPCDHFLDGRNKGLPVPYSNTLLNLINPGPPRPS